MALTRQQLEQQLVAAHRSGNVQAAQQAAYAIRAYDQAPLSADVPQPTINVSDLVVGKNDPSADPRTWGTRPDGSKKGQGFLGLLRRPDGGVSSEISIGVEMDGKEISLPLMVPTLTRDEVKTLLALPQDENFNRNLPPSIRDKAITFARRRLAQGKSTFASPEESQPVRFAPPPIERVPKPTFGSWLENVGIGYGEELGKQVRDIGGMVERGVSAFTQDPLKASAAAVMSVLEPWRQGLTKPVQTAKDVGTGVVETGKQMYQQAQSGPIGLGGVAGQIVGLPGPDLPGGRRKPTMAELDVYHGTPHKFEPEEGAPLGRFRSEKIGTGEGAQAYGHGLYLAEGRKTAEGYAATLANRDAANQNRLNAHANAQRLANLAGDPQFAADDIRYALEANPDHPQKELLTDTLRFLESGNYKKPLENTGNVYTVDLPDAKIDQMLDWDKPLSEQPKSVRDALQRAGIVDFENNIGPTSTGEIKSLGWTRNVENLRGEELYRRLTERDYTPEKFAAGASRKLSERAASDALRQLGIPGIKFLDQGSRAAGQGTRNFVVFPGEEQHLKILGRD